MNGLDPLPACSFNTIKSNARSLFTANNDKVFSDIKTMEDAHKRGGASAATNPGFNVIREAEFARGGTRVYANSGATADAFTKAVFACTSYNMVVPGFSVEKAWNEGVYAVRGGGAAAGDRVGAAFTQTTPRWGAEPGTPSSDWSNSGSTRFLLYGTPQTTAFSGENTVPIGSNTGFDLSTHPAGLTFAARIGVGACLSSVASNRLLHKPSSGPQSVGALHQLEFCDPSYVVASTSPSHSGFFAFAKQALSLMAPQEAFACCDRGGVGSLESGLSPFEVVLVNLSAAQVIWATQPTSGNKVNVDMSPPVRVRVLTAAGTAVEGASVVLNLFDNNGQPSSGSTGLGSQLTDAFGIATFANIKISSPGGYKMTATVSGIGNGGATGPESDRFIVNP